jgi:hypothetical protein
VKIVSFKEKHKLANKWEQEPYKVLGQPIPDIPVFTVQREDGEGRKRNIHRNLLLPVGDIRETPVKPVLISINFIMSFLRMGVPIRFRNSYCIICWVL